MRHIIQGLWIGDCLSEIERLCIKSFLYHGHEFHLYCYDDIENIPVGATVHNADDILPKSQIYRSKNGGLSSFSDYFRWLLLKKKGGMWVDMDVICLKKFDFPDEIIFGLQSQHTVAIGVLGFPADYFLPKIMAKACDDVNLFQPIDTEKTLVKKNCPEVSIWKREKPYLYKVFGADWASVFYQVS